MLGRKTRMVIGWCPQLEGLWMFMEMAIVPQRWVIGFAVSTIFEPSPLAQVGEFELLNMTHHQSSPMEGPTPNFSHTRKIQL